MALSVVEACTSSAEEAGVSGIAVFLTVLFSVYVGLDCMLAWFTVSRKASEAEKVALQCK